jgi:3-oxoacyl-[acyl-carrier protein] reductase
MMNLKGKVSIVTGGGQGLGRTIALSLAKHGSDVAVCDIKFDEARTVAKEIISIGAKALAMHVDVSSSANVARMVGRVLEEFGKIDILVNNAGICRAASIEDTTEEDWDRVMAVNLKGVFLCSQAVMETMKKQRSGRIVNMGSLAGKVGGVAAGASYAASKAGVMCFTKSLAKELAPYGVTANGLAPGVIETDLSRGLSGGDWSNYLSGIPLGYIGSPEDVANAVLFFAADEARYITGEILDVNGGMLMD